MRSSGTKTIRFLIGIKMVEKVLKNLLCGTQSKIKVFKVGGAVRDQFIKGQTPIDEDYLVCGVPFGELLKYLNDYGQVEHVGVTFGVIKFYPRGCKLATDIALPRKEISTGPGHKDFKVEFDHTLSVDEDLKRRDFTMNAIAINLQSGDIYDPFNGRKDIDKKVIRVVHKKSFREDPLRILRGVQFAARLNFKIEDKTLKLMKQHKHLLEYISAERIAGELNKIILAPSPSIGFRYLEKIGALSNILPELLGAKYVVQSRKGDAATVFEHTMLAIDAASQDNPKVRWAVLFHDLGKSKCHSMDKNGKEHFIGHEIIGATIAKKYLGLWKFPTAFIEEVMHLIKYHMFDAPPNISDKAVRRLIARVGTEHIFNLVELRRADRSGTTTKISMAKVDNLVKKIKRELYEKPFSLSDLKVNGHDVIKVAGIKPGKEIGLILDILLYLVLYKDVPNERDTLIRHIPCPGEGIQEYCPHGTLFRLSQIKTALNSDVPFAWNCGSDCGYICEKRY